MVQQTGGVDSSNLDLELEEELDMTSIVNMRNILNNKVFFVKMRNMPVNYCFIERMTMTLDDLLNTHANMAGKELFAIFFQVIFGLACANKHFAFVHNDLHSENVMFQPTKEKHLYYSVANKIYRIPTYGYVAKIIDFARATFKIGETPIFSDAFRPDGEASGQYRYPGCEDNIEYWGEAFTGADEPNPSFDMVRLAVSIQSQIYNISGIHDFLRKICLSDDGTNMLDKADDFDLYIDIARNCHQANPRSLLDDSVFERFIVKPEKLRKGKHIYCMD